MSSFMNPLRVLSAVALLVACAPDQGASTSSQSDTGLAIDQNQECQLIWGPILSSFLGSLLEGETSDAEEMLSSDEFQWVSLTDVTTSPREHFVAYSIPEFRAVNWPADRYAIGDVEVVSCDTTNVGYRASIADTMDGREFGRSLVGKAAVGKDGLLIVLSIGITAPPDSSRTTHKG